MYDFDRVIDRRGTNSLKWNVKEGELAMWVADMDFAAAPCIREALEKRMANGVFGYNDVPESWYESYGKWWGRRHGFPLEKEWLIFSTGVVPSISSIVRKLTTPAEKVLLQPPVYNVFYNSIVNNGRQVLESPLVYEDGQYFIDFEQLEKDLSDPQTTLMILCNPHNPIGKIWDSKTLQKIGHLAAKHHVVVLSDEIHCDLTKPGKEYIPFASIDEVCRDNSITCIAPTKCFNIAGMQTSAISVPNPVLRHKVNRGLNTDECAEPNTFAVDVTVAAFESGEPWLVELNDYIQKNKELVESFIETHIQGIHVVPSEATYLLWLDCSRLTDDADQLAAFIWEHTGLYLSGGGQYGTTGKAFIRMNVACPSSMVEDGLQRLKKGIELYEHISSGR